jgi:energy-coupling factor transport system ATP-binding protein
MNKIEFRDLYFSYNAGDEILKGINLSFNSESTAIIGQNGAGKTTFVKLLKGLLKPASGDVL